MKLCHVTTATAWASASAAGEYAPPQLAEDGFLHCCTEVQLGFVLRRHFEGIPNLLLLTFEAQAVPSVLRWVESEPGQDAFPHLHGPIPLGAIRSVAPVDGARPAAHADAGSAGPPQA